MHPWALKMLLAEHQVPWETAWGPEKGTKTFDDLLTETRLGETRLQSRSHPENLGRRILVRKIRTALVRIYRREPRLTLLEYKRKGRVWVVRDQHLASMSEKMRRFRRRRETFEKALLRGFREELEGMVVSPEELSKDFVKSEVPQPPDIEPSHGYPYLYSANQLEFASWVMPEQYVRPFYIECDGKGIPKSVFTWWAGWNTKDPYPLLKEVIPQKLLALAV